MFHQLNRVYDLETPELNYDSDKEIKKRQEEKIEKEKEENDNEEM